MVVSNCELISQSEGIARTIPLCTHFSSIQKRGCYYQHCCTHTNFHSPFFAATFLRHFSIFLPCSNVRNLHQYAISARFLQNTHESCIFISFNATNTCSISAIKAQSLCLNLQTSDQQGLQYRSNLANVRNSSAILVKFYILSTKNDERQSYFLELLSSAVECHLFCLFAQAPKRSILSEFVINLLQ